MSERPHTPVKREHALAANRDQKLRTTAGAIVDYCQSLTDGSQGALTDEQTETVHIIRETATDLLQLLPPPVDALHPKPEAGKCVLQTNTPNGHKHIFIADDDTCFRDVLKCVLGGEGYQIDEATSGREVIANFPRVQPDLLLLDLKMPDVDGWQVIRYLAEHPPLKHHQIIVITGDTLDEQETNTLRRHAADVIRKGEFKVKTVIEKVATVLEDQPHAQAATH